MLWNFIKISFRNIRRHKLFSVINIAGLTLSITICLAVLMIVKNQLDFDTFHPEANRTYRVITEATHENGYTQRFATAPLPLGDMIRQDYSHVETGVRFYRYPSPHARANNKTLDVNGALADPAFFTLFHFELESGDPGSVLSQPNSVMLTEETANRFFDERNPVGENFYVEELGDLTVTGILKEDELDQSHLQFDYLASLSTLVLSEHDASRGRILEDWSSLDRGYTYLLLEEGTPAEALREALSTVSERVNRQYELGDDYQSYAFDIQGLPEITPGEDLQNGIPYNNNRSASEIWAISAIALVILLMACFNYTNLSVARALKRSREVGLYKVLGARRSQIIFQFVVQSTMVALLSLLLAYALLPFIPLPENFTRELATIVPDLELIVWFTLFSLFTGLLAGILPAWLITGQQPIPMLRQLKNLDPIGGLSFRKSLVVVQFALSTILLIATAVVYQQTRYTRTADYGFQQQNVINMDLQGRVDAGLMKEKISGLAGVRQVSAISNPLGFFPGGSVDIRKERTDSPVQAEQYSVDRDLIPNLDLTMAGGRNFPEGAASRPESHIVVNENFLSPLGWESPAEAVGETVWLDDSTQVEIAGVVEDFHHKTLILPIRPMIFRYRPSYLNHLNIRLASGADTSAVTSQLEEIWAEQVPTVPAEYRFSDQAIQEFASNEQDIASFGYYALIALVISFLGLLGMVTYRVEIRTREVGIRKVLGAGVSSIITLLSKEFVWLLLLAGGIGIPAGYWIGQQYLNTFAYHVPIRLDTLLSGFTIMALFGLLAIGWQTWQVARRNPVEAIRTE